MNTNIKMIFLDLDGTLLDDSKKVSDKNKEAISDALKKGYKVVICTGRPLCSAKKQFDALGMNKDGCYAITFNGGLVYDIYNNKILRKQTVTTSYIRHIFAIAEEQNIYMQAYNDDDILCQEDTKEGQEYSGRCLVERKIVPDVFDTLGDQEPYKALAIARGYDREKLEAFREQLSDWAKDKVDMFFSCYELLEFVPKGINKGESVHFLAQYLNIPAENTIAVGDAENDIPMILSAGLGVAMNNADTEVKKAADYITVNDNNENGVAEVIEKFML